MIEKNLNHLPGKTVIFIDVSASMNAKISGGEKKYGSVSTCMNIACILGLMIDKKTEKCELYLFAN